MPAALQMSPKCTLHEMSRAKSVKLQEIKETRNHQRKSNYFKNNTGSALIFQANGYFWVIPIIVDIFGFFVFTLFQNHIQPKISINDQIASNNNHLLYIYKRLLFEENWSFTKIYMINIKDGYLKRTGQLQKFWVVLYNCVLTCFLKKSVLHGIQWLCVLLLYILYFVSNGMVGCPTGCKMQLTCREMMSATFHFIHTPQNTALHCAELL